MKNYYYVRLNENQIGVNIVTSPKKINADGYIEIPDYSETYLYRKWENNQWSQERYEPSFEVELQQKVEQLEQENQTLVQGVSQIQAQNIQLEGMMMEMMMAISALTNGGAE